MSFVVIEFAPDGTQRRSERRYKSLGYAKSIGIPWAIAHNVTHVDIVGDGRRYRFTNIKSDKYDDLYIFDPNQRWRRVR